MIADDERDLYGWIETYKRAMKGYWVGPTGKLEVTLYTPTFMERLRESLVDGRTWVATRHD